MMQQQPLRKAMTLMEAACLIFFNHACDSSSEAGPGSLNKNKSELNVGEVGLNTPSDAQELRLSGLKITKDLQVEVSGDFEISINEELMHNSKPSHWIRPIKW